MGGTVDQTRKNDSDRSKEAVPVAMAANSFNRRRRTPAGGNRNGAAPGRRSWELDISSFHFCTR